MTFCHPGNLKWNGDNRPLTTAGELPAYQQDEPPLHTASPLTAYLQVSPKLKEYAPLLSSISFLNSALAGVLSMRYGLSLPFCNQGFQPLILRYGPTLIDYLRLFPNLQLLSHFWFSQASNEGAFTHKLAAHEFGH